MKLWRKLTVLGVILASAATAWASDLTMHSSSTSTCNTSSTLTVTIDGGSVTGVAGGQFFIGWDSRLSLTTVTAGPGLTLFFNAANGGGRDIAVGIPNGGPTVGAQTMATLTFSVSGAEACNAPSLVYFR